MTEVDWPKPFNIGGPCAAESRVGFLKAAEEASKREVRYVRGSAFKPRTKYGWDGVGAEVAAEWYAEAVSVYQIIPCSEVGNGHDVDSIINILDKLPGAKKAFLWIGARNYYHPNQESIGRAVSGIDWIKVGVKNPIGPDKEQWLGAVDHLIHGGASPDQLVMIHRGFKPSRDGYRNPPDWKMADEVRLESKLPMVIDTSHMGGEREKVISLTRWLLSEVINGRMQVDGLMLEIHDFMNRPLTDEKQQLSWDLYNQYIKPSIDRWVAIYHRQNNISPLLVPV